MKNPDDRLYVVGSFLFCPCNYSGLQEYGDYYLIFPKDADHDRSTIHEIYKVVRILGVEYGIVLAVVGTEKKICFRLAIGEDAETMADIMEWLGSNHPAWEIELESESASNIEIIGTHISKNMFHAKRLERQGEMIEK